MIYIWSDLHLYHKNIIAYENRPFASLDEMHKTLIQNWKDTVTKHDTLINLGDISFSNKETTKQIISNLPGKKVLIMGNHDRARTVGWWEEVGFNRVYEYPIIIDGFYILSHEPVYVGPNMPYCNIHGHSHTESSTNPFKFNVSVENIGYKPISFDAIKERLHDRNEGQI